MDYLAFEQPIADLEAEIKLLESAGEPSAQSAEQIRELRRKLARLTRDIYQGLSPWQIVQVARHKDRPHTADYTALMAGSAVDKTTMNIGGEGQAHSHSVRLICA